MKDIIWRHDDNQPRFRHSAWRKVLEDKEQKPILFSQPLQEISVPFTKFLSPSAVWDRFHTLSQIAILQGKELEVSCQFKEVYFDISVFFWSFVVVLMHLFTGHQSRGR